MPTQQLRPLLAKVLLLLLVLFAATPAFAIQPIQTLILPLVNTAGLSDDAAAQIIQDTLKQPFKYPYYSLLPAATGKEAAQAYLTTNKTARLTDKQSLAQIADTVSADLVLVVELPRFRLNRSFAFWQDDETYVDSDIVLKCYAYSALSKRYDVIEAAKYDHEPESIYTNTNFIFKDLTQQLLSKQPYKRIPLAGFEKPDTAKQQLPD
ncbi:MAG: hypothetical protein H6Q72_193 [Firmicutes bacterium]|nr:hypothetical protein [Bacillota bacterium]